MEKTSASNIMNEMMSSRARQAKVRADRLELQRAHQKELDLRLSRNIPDIVDLNLGLEKIR